MSIRSIDDTQKIGVSTYKQIFMLIAKTLYDSELSIILLKMHLAIWDVEQF